MPSVGSVCHLFVSCHRGPLALPLSLYLLVEGLQSATVPQLGIGSPRGPARTPLRLPGFQMNAAIVTK